MRYVSSRLVRSTRSGATGLRRWAPILATVALLAVGPLARDATAVPSSTSVLRSTGELTPTTARPATGTFEFRETIRINGRERPGYVIEASGLDASRGDDGRRVQHGAFLLPTGSGSEIFLGSIDVNGKGDGRLRKRNAKRLLAGAGTSLRALTGATVEVRGPDGTVLTGVLPAFALDGAGTSADRRETYGLFVRISGAAPTGATGRFTLRTDERESGTTRNRAVIEGSSLPTSSTYSVYILGPRTVFLGSMQSHPNQGATLSLDSERAAIPGGITRWSEFNGGRIEIRRGSTVFYRGAITIFRAASERVEDAGWARSRATVELSPTAAGGAGRALLTASVLTKPRRRAQEIRVRALDLPPSGNPYAVATLEPDGTRHVIARFDTRGDAPAGGFRITTRRRGSTPPGGVLGQAGRPVEVTDVFGTVVLTGTFPALD